MFELVLRAPEALVEQLSDALIEEAEALSVSVEDADAGSRQEQPLFGEPGMPAPRPGWERSTLRVLFDNEAAATDAATLVQAVRDRAGATPPAVQQQEIIAGGRYLSIRGRNDYFHSPNDVIVDASMPAMIRNGGKMYGADGRLKDVKAVMPESTFARIYQEMINFCKWHGAFDPKTMGTVPNVGLMAQQAEEYGSHDKTFEIPEDGVANITDLATGEVLLTQKVETGDIWRMCQVKDAAVRDWVKLAVSRARNSGMPAVFWLDPYRPHENELIKKVNKYLKDHDTSGLEIYIMSQVRAMRFTLPAKLLWVGVIALVGLAAQTGVVMIVYIDNAYERRLEDIFDVQKEVAEAVARERPVPEHVESATVRQARVLELV